MNNVERAVNKLKLQIVKKLIFAITIITIIVTMIPFSNLKHQLITLKHDEYFEIIATMIGLLGIFAGFLLASFSITISNIGNQLQNANNEEEKIQLNEYWAYVLGTFKPIFYMYIFVLGVFSILLIFTNTNSFASQITIFTVLLSIFVLYLTVDIVSDYLSNPFRKKSK